MDNAHISQPNASIEEVFSFVRNMEDELELFEWRVAGVQAWPIIRYYFFQNIVRALGSLEASKQRIDKKRLKLDRLISAAWYLFTRVNPIRLGLRALRNVAPFLPAARSKVAFFPFYRRDAEGVDAYSEETIRQFGNRAITIGVGEFDKTVPGLVNRAELSWIFSKALSPFANRWIKRNFTDADQAIYQTILQAYRERFGLEVEGNWSEYPALRLQRYLTATWGYGLLFRLENVKTVFVVAPLTQGIYGAARLAAARFVELQHGSVSTYHPMHNWPPGVAIDNVPDEYWAWGENWVRGIGFASRTTPKIVGALNSFESVRNAKYAIVTGQVAVMSSPDNTARLFAATLECAIAHPDKTFVYKGHPRENLDAQIQQLATMPSVTNITFVEKTQGALPLIAQSEFVIGVNSTTLFEAAGLGKRVAVVGISGWEIAEALVLAGGAEFIQDSADLGARLDSIPTAKNPTAFYAPQKHVDISRY
jgi:hypothetical protein